jgi:hypothetical protein
VTISARATYLGELFADHAAAGYRPEDRRNHQNNDRRPERVEIRFPAFAGTGTSDRAIAAVVGGGRTVFQS